MVVRGLTKVMLMWCKNGGTNTPMKTHRQMVTLSEDRAEFLKQEARRMEITVSELLRRLIDAYRKAQKK